MLFGILASTWLLAGCGDNNSETSDIETKPTTERESRPADWTCVDALDPTSFMIVELAPTDMPAAINAQDLLAAFVGNECRGAAEPTLLPDGSREFVMLLMASMYDERNDEDVVLRYYSEDDGAIYLSQPIAFQPFANWTPVASENFRTEWKKQHKK